jgi:hypothetical protein
MAIESNAVMMGCLTRKDAQKAGRTAAFGLDRCGCRTATAPFDRTGVDY